MELHFYSFQAIPKSKKWMVSCRFDLAGSVSYSTTWLTATSIGITAFESESVALYVEFHEMMLFGIVSVGDFGALYRTGTFLYSPSFAFLKTRQIIMFTTTEYGGIIAIGKLEVGSSLNQTENQITVIIANPVVILKLK